MNPAPKPAKKPKSARSPMRKTPLNKRNPKRRKSEFQRAYHSKARVRFVKDLWCVTDEWCGLMNGSENAHIETGGTGRKADYTKIVPLCPMHHAQLHALGRKTFEDTYNISLEIAAEETQAAWLRVSGAPE